MEYRYEATTADDINSTDLREEASRLDAEGTAYECYLFDIDGIAEKGTMLYVPSSGRAGIAWGADASWTDCKDPEDALRRWDADEMVN